MRPRKVAVHTLLGLAQARLIRCLSAGIIKSHNLLVLGPILVKFHIRTLLNESFPATYRFWKCARAKLHFTPVHTLCQLKHDKALFPPLRRVVEFRARYGKKTARRFGVGQIWTVCDSRLRKNSASYLFGLVQTCSNLSTIQ